MTQTACSNCGNQKDEKLRVCPHCRVQFFPCRQCKTILEIKKYRFVETFKEEEWTDEIVGSKYKWDYSTDTWDHSFVTRRVKDTVTKYRIQEIPCPICNVRKPFKRFGNTPIGWLIFSSLILMANIIGIVLPLGILVFILSIKYVGEVVFKIPYWWAIYLLLVMLSIYFVPALFVSLVKVIFGDMLGIPLDGLYHWER